MRKNNRIAIAGIKGGTGKSTLAMALGTVLREKFNKKVVLVDCDPFNRSIVDQRSNEIIFHEQNGELIASVLEDRQQEVRYLDPLPVEQMQEVNENEAAELEKKYSDVDVFVYDMKGSDGDYDTFEFLTQMDYILFPILLENQHMEPNFYWIQGINFACRYIKDIRLKRVMMLFNFVFVDGLDVHLQSWWEYIAKQNGIEVIPEYFFKNPEVAKSITQITSTDKDYFQSISIVPSDNILSKTNFLDIVKTILGIMEKGEERPIIKAPMRTKKKHITTEELIAIANKKISFLHKFIARLESEKLPQSQLGMIEVCLEALKEEELNSLLAVSPNDNIKSKKLHEQNGVDKEKKEKQDASDDDDDDFDEAELKALQLYKKFLREERKNNK